MGSQNGSLFAALMFHQRQVKCIFRHPTSFLFFTSFPHIFRLIINDIFF